MTDPDFLRRRPANHQPLTPLKYLERAAATHPDAIAIVHGPLRRSYRAFYERSRALASALRAAGVRPGETVATLLLNTPPQLEAHYGVPMAGAVLNAINTRLDAAGVAFILDHGAARVFMVDSELAPLAREALAQASAKPLLVEYVDPTAGAPAAFDDATDYETFVAAGDPAFEWAMPDDEWDTIALNYTSGTTGDPKGVLYHHRGAALLAMGNVIHAQLPPGAVYLWTLPMFHCNGWCFPWTVSLVAGTHVCLRQVRAAALYDAIAEHGVTHLCGAPIVMSTLLGAKLDEKRDFSQRVGFFTAAAPPPESVLAGMDDAGFDVTHLYGLTECYGPAVVNEWKAEWAALPGPERAAKKARQGVRYAVLEDLAVLDPETLAPVPPDGATMGEVMMRGNVVMKGYHTNPSATEKALGDGWFRTGDLGVLHPDGYIQLKDRAKDIIISGGENISSIEVEEALYAHPAVAFAAVVAKPDEKWGETPCAFVELKPGREATAEEIIAWCRDRLAHYKAPRHVVFCEVPKTSTGKIQKFELRQRAKA
ncbi:AMP-binding protein [Rubrimonas cliftonensis]|uniref:3-methylmercaptopropionyl-CoA ligase n=1 Tax=Rubrimonas cliftonensis TaxID=89524 RepID=A0A1H4AEB7_9RHOB|nr:AMP-binding protein [Rubrimonas cliftonensis]SEA34463.1 fatty-acyl-CoA synthase [Rubrimonas cliftonensis]